MIKIFLPDNFPKRPDIQRVFSDLIQKILPDFQGFQVTHPKKQFSLASKAEKEKFLAEFLVAKDFYDYKFTCTGTNSLEDAFAYKKLSSKARHIILNAMDVPVCPYCNMNYTIKFTRDGEVRNTADIDHFYVKEKHPEYALCLYNMVPACPVCNSRLKLNRDMTVASHIYPHRESFAGKKEFRINNMAQYLLHQEDTAQLALEDCPGAKSDPRADASAQLFCLEARYQSVHTYAEELIGKAQIYTEQYNKELEQNFQQILQGSSVKDLAFGPKETEEDYARRSLGKLRMDLLKQLKIY